MGEEGEKREGGGGSKSDGWHQWVSTRPPIVFFKGV